MTQLWYRKSLHPVLYLLLPLAYCFSLIVSVRRFLYRCGFLSTTRLAVPVIVVGNIALGGTGKTPFVIWLAKFLKQQGFTPGIVSRGVGGKSHKTPCSVQANDKPEQVGDEALLLARHSECPVVLCKNRAQAASFLLANFPCDIVITDDGLQHYKLARDIEICMVDGERQFGNGTLLPAGPLRESKKRLASVDMIITTQGEGACAMQLAGIELVSMADETCKLPLAQFRDKQVHAVAGIGNPGRFFKMLSAQALNLLPHVFPDHYLFKAQDFKFTDNYPIVMTEKDAVKCREFADERFWYLPVTAKISDACVKQLLNVLSTKLKIRSLSHEKIFV